MSDSVPSKMINMPAPLDIRVGGVEWGSKQHLDHLDAMIDYWAKKSRQQDAEIAQLQDQRRAWLDTSVPAAVMVKQEREIERLRAALQKIATCEANHNGSIAWQSVRIANAALSFETLQQHSSMDPGAVRSTSTANEGPNAICSCSWDSTYAVVLHRDPQCSVHNQRPDHE